MGLVLITILMASFVSHIDSQFDLIPLPRILPSSGPSGLTIQILNFAILTSFTIFSTVSGQRNAARGSALAGSECPNACSGHGKCGPKAVCECMKNWMLNDCSGRMCQFGMAHVDIPKGDLDMSQTITGISTRIVQGSQLFPNGTTELYPRFSNSRDELIPQTGHEYVECSNKGFCDRDMGQCRCLSGYEGSACQRMSCPIFQSKTCNERGVCRRIQDIAEMVYDGNVYDLWDRHTTMGCVCDPEFYGPACQHRKCKYGVDPLYLGLKWPNLRYSNWSYVIWKKSSKVTLSGNYTLTFYDIHGQAWITDPIPYDAYCSILIDALEGLPQNVVKKGSVRCLQWRQYESIAAADEPILAIPNPYQGIKYTIAFDSNAGVLKAPEVNFNSAEMVATLQGVTTGNTSEIGSFVYANGFHGENVDYVQNLCENVDVTLRMKNGVGNLNTYDYLDGLSPFEARLLKRCLGLSESATASTNEDLTVLGESFGWQYGTTFSPHLIKLVDTAAQITDLCPAKYNQRGTRAAADLTYNDYCTHSSPPGFYALVVYDSMRDVFKLMNRPGEDYGLNTTFSVYTTDGFVNMVSNEVVITTDTENQYSNTVFSRPSTGTYSGYLGELDCETNPKGANGANDCLEVGKYVFFIDPFLTRNSYFANPKYLNMYQVKKVSRERRETSGGEYDLRPEIKLDKPITSNWIRGIHNARAFIFTLPTSVGYKVVEECSNRGNCEQMTGLCDCYAGYDLDDCSRMMAAQTF